MAPSITKPPVRCQIDERVGARALSWLHKNKAYLLAPPSLEPPSEALQTAVAETSLLVWLLSRAETRANIQHLEGLRKIVISTFSEPLMHNFLKGGPPEAAIGHLVMRLAIPLEIANKCLPSGHLVDLLEKRNVFRINRSPMRQLELDYILTALNLDRGPFDLSCEISYRRMAITDQNLCNLPPAQVYEFTHIIYYLSDFGHAYKKYFDESAIQNIGQQIDLLMCRFLQEQHFDLIAELLLARKCLWLPTSDLYKRAWTSLECAQAREKRSTRKSAIIPDLKKPPQYDSCGRAKFLSNYHICLVTALAAFIPADYSGGD